MTGTGVIVTGLGTPRSARENFGSTWEHPGAPSTTLGAPATVLGAPATSLGAHRITVQQSGKTSSFGTLLVRLKIIATTYRLPRYSVCILIYVSTHGISGLAAGGAWEQCEVRRKMMIPWTQRYTPRLWSSEFRDDFDAATKCIWRCSPRS